MVGFCFFKSLLKVQFIAVLLSLGEDVGGDISVVHHNPVMYSVSGACLILPGFGISAMTGMEKLNKCHREYCLAVEKNSLTISWNFRQLFNTM